MAVVNFEVGGFGWSVLWSKVGGAGAPTEIDGTATGILELTSTNGDLAASAFGLDPVGSVCVFLVLEPASGDQTLMTAHHVDSGTAASPSDHAAIFNSEIADPREFDPVVVSRASDPEHVEPVQSDVMCR